MENTTTDLENTVDRSDNSVINPSQVKGWGIDADPKNDPTYPIKKRNNGEHAGYTWERPTQQAESVEVLHSNERPNLSAAFGTSTPPSGVSGMIRRAAFNYSENSYGHWVPLMLADRVGMIEGIVDDLAHGHIPNIFGEMGLKAEWKHNRQSLVTKIVVGTVIASVALAYLRRDREEEEIDDDFETDE
jgi:hypothetical protein